MQIFGRERIKRFEINVLSLLNGAAMIHAMPPFGMGVAKAAHLKAAKRFKAKLLRRSLKV